MDELELTLVEKSDGPLTKKITIDEAGSVKSDGSACVMTRGTAYRFRPADLGEFARAISGFQPQHALTLGCLRLDLPDRVIITTKAKLDSPARADLITRSADNIFYRPGKTALALLDFDAKGMPSELSEHLHDLGGFEAALTTVLPELATAARLARASTSAGLYRDDTGERVTGSNGMHLFVPVRDGTDIERFLKTLHTRCWLAGLGWLTVGAGGQVLERSIVDRVVGSPERLVFEGPPILAPPLAQDPLSRRPIVIDGKVLDTILACPPLTIYELAQYREARARMERRFAPEIGKTRAAFISRQAGCLAKLSGMSQTQAARAIERQCVGVLLSDIELPFDDNELAGTKVYQVLADPDHFVGETLADPLEGIEYGRGKAKIMRRADGAIWINSFAHGRTTYELKYDYKTAAAALGNTPADHVPAAFIRLVFAGDFDPSEVEQLRNLAHIRSGIGKRSLDAILKGARAQREAQDAKEMRDQLLAERRDPRPLVPAPMPDDEWLPQMTTINEVLSKCAADVPPLRDADRMCAQIRAITVPSLSRLSREAANGNTTEARLPPPEQLLLVKMTEEEVAEMIEHHIEYFVDTPSGYRSVHLNAQFVRHYMKRDDGALPIATTVVHLPIVLHDGSILAGPGLHRASGAIFCVPPAMTPWLPRFENCSPASVAEAMRFLTDEWLCDVATDYSGKCVIIACALTVIERALLPERPAFFITAGQRGGGKTTVIHMISMAILGIPACAAAWSKDEDERRKALLSYLSAGLPMLTWDNISRGSTISCPHIEKALTNEFYSDRVLGVSEHRLVLSSTVHVFTGNNISPRGDTASRSLTIRLAVNRPDPENREFKHPDPLAWTEAHRGRILAALYNILLGNPRRSPGEHPPAETRFKTWYEMIGSAVENAADEDARARQGVCPPTFRKLFLAGEDDEEQTHSLATVLDVLSRRYPGNELFQAREIASYAGLADEESISFKAALEMACGMPIKIISAPVINWRLQALTDAPVIVGDKMFVLQYLKPEKSGRNGGFRIVQLA